MNFDAESRNHPLSSPLDRTPPLVRNEPIVRHTYRLPRIARHSYTRNSAQEIARDAALVPDVLSDSWRNIWVKWHYGESFPPTSGEKTGFRNSPLHRFGVKPSLGLVPHSVSVQTTAPIPKSPYEHYAMPILLQRTLGFLILTAVIGGLGVQSLIQLF